MQYNLKEMVSNGKQVTFVYFKKDALWYETECGFRFPVPVSDTEEGIFLPKDNAMFFMRYIRKEIASCLEEQAAPTT